MATTKPSQLQALFDACCAVAEDAPGCLPKLVEAATAWGREHPTAETPARRNEALDALLEAARTERALRPKSDREIAKLLIEVAWPDLDITSPVTALIEQAIERLERAGGEGLPEPVGEEP